MKDPTKLSPREITVFLHNARLASLEDVEDSRIPALHCYMTDLLEFFRTESLFTPVELAAVLTTTAYELYTGEMNENKKTQTKR